MATAYTDQVQKVYIAYYGRAADPVGLTYWAAKVETDGLAGIMAQFGASAEATTLYGSLSDTAMVNALYQQSFGRDADFAGLMYYAGELSSGAMTAASIAQNIFDGASGTDATILANKLIVAKAYTAAIDSAAEVVAYSGTVAAASARALLTTVDADTVTASFDVVTSVASIVTTASATPAVAGTTVVLTATTDTITGSAGNDAISASGTTLQSDDVIDGNDGQDTFSLTTTTGTPTRILNISDVESIGANATVATVLNMINGTGYETLTSKYSSANLTFSNVKTLATVASNGATAGDLQVEFADAVFTTGDDAVTISLTDGTVANVEIGGTTAANEFEIINVKSSSVANTLDLEDEAGAALSGLKTLNISGDAKLTVGLDMTTAAGVVVDASTFTGVLAANMTSDTITSITGGAGDDVIDLTGVTALATTLGNTLAAKTIDGGAGADKIVIDESLTAVVASAAGTHSLTAETVEIKDTVLQADNASKNLALDVSKITGATSVMVTINNADTGNTDSSVTTLTGLTTQGVEFSSVEAAAQAVTGLSVALGDATGTADSVTVTSVNVTGSANQVNQLDTLTIAQTASQDVETLNLVVSAADNTAGTVNGTIISTLTASNTSNLVISGDGNATIGAVDMKLGTQTALATTDASAATGKLKLTMEAGEVSVTGGSGNDTISMTTTLSTYDVIDGGAGTDVLKLIDSTNTNTYKGGSITNVETLSIDTITSGTDIFDLTNYTGLVNVRLTDTGASTSTVGYGTTVDKINGQNIQLVTWANGGANDVDFSGTVMLLKGATGVTNVDVEIVNTVTASVNDGVALAATPTFKTDTGKVTVTNSNMTAALYHADNSFKVDGTSATKNVTSVVLAGSGLSASLTDAITTVADGAGGFVAVTSVDASALAGDLVMTGLTTASGATVSTGTGNNQVTISLADAARDALVITDAGGTADTLVITGIDTGAYRPGATGFETVTATTSANHSAAMTLDLTDASGTTKVNLVAGTLNGTNMDENIDVIGLATDSTVSLKGVFGTGADDITIGGGAKITVTNHAVAKSASSGTVLSNATTADVKIGWTSAGATTSSLDVDVLTATKLTTLNVGSADVDASAAQFIGMTEINTLTAAALTSLVIDAGQGTVNVGNTAVTADKLTTVTITGDNIVNFGGSTSSTAALATVSAGTATGAITIGSGVDFAATATVTTGTGNDSVAMDVSPIASPSLTLDMGEKTADSDTLNMVGVASNATTIKLAAADQIVQVGGTVDSAVQTGIENVNVSSITGAGTFTIIGSADANTIVGSGNADYLTGGEGLDVITGGAGIDTIILTETTAKADIVAIGATDLTNANRDTVTGFAVADDSIRIDATFTTGNITDGAVTGELLAVTAGHGTALVVNSSAVIYELGFEFDADVSLATATKANILSGLGAADDATGSSLTAGLFTVNADADSVLLIAYQNSKAFMFKVTDGANGGTDAAQTILAAEGTDLVELVGVYEGIAVGAFTFADFIA